MEKVKAALYEIFTAASLAAATIAVLLGVGARLPIISGSIQDWAFVAVACAAAKMAR